MCYYELHIEQFNIFLEKQSFTYRRQEDAKGVKRSSCVQARTSLNLLCLTVIRCSFIFKLTNISYDKYINFCARIVNFRYEYDHVHNF